MQVGGDSEGCSNQATFNAPVAVFTGDGNSFTITEQRSNATKPERARPDRGDWSRLINKYKQDDSWMCPLPWDLSVRFPPEDYYVDLDLGVYDRTGKWLRTQNAKLENLFDPNPGCSVPPLRVLVQGDAGFGKSTLCLKGGYDWVVGKNTFRSLDWDKTLPVLIKLRDLALGRSEATGADTEELLKIARILQKKYGANMLQEEIFNHIKSLYKTEGESKELQLILKDMGRNFLLILDGYDELDEEGQNAVKKMFSWKNDKNLFEQNTILVTSRPTEDTRFLLLFDKHFKIIQMSEMKIEQIVIAFDTNIPSGESSTFMNEVMQEPTSYPKTRLVEDKLQKRTGKEIRMKGMSCLMVSLICWITKQSGFSYNTTNFIYELILFLCKRCNERENFGLSDEEIKDALWRFGALLLQQNQRTTIFFWRLRNTLGNKLFRFLTLTGILKYDGASSWEPVHKSFFDTLAENIVDYKPEDSLSPNDFNWLLTEAKSMRFYVNSNWPSESAHLFSDQNHYGYLGYFGYVCSLSYSSHCDQVAITENRRDASSYTPIYTICFNLPWLMNDIYSTNEVVFGLTRSHQRFLGLFLLMNRGNRILLNYVFEEDNTTVLKEVFTVISNQTRIRYRFPKSQNILVSSDGGEKLKFVICEVLEKVFGCPKKTHFKTQIEYILDMVCRINDGKAFRYIQLTQFLKRRQACVTITSMTSLSAERYATRDDPNMRNLQCINFYLEHNGVWTTTSPDDEDYVRTLTWDDYNKINFYVR